METKISLARKIPGAKIMAVTADGRDVVLKHRFAHRDDAKLVATLSKIRDAGAINMAHWRPAKAGEF